MCLMEKSPGLPFTHDGVGFHSTGGGVTSDVSTRGRQSSIPYPLLWITLHWDGLHV